MTGMETMASSGWIEVGIVFIVIGLPVICCTLVTLIRMFSGGGRTQREATREETRMMQELHATMEKIEDRIESLEAIVVDRERRKETRL